MITAPYVDPIPKHQIWPVNDCDIERPCLDETSESAHMLEANLKARQSPHRLEILDEFGVGSLTIGILGPKKNPLLLISVARRFGY